MPGTATPVFPQTIRNVVAQIANSGSETDLFTAGANGSKIDAFCISSASAVNVSVFVKSGTPDIQIGFVAVAANSGITAASPTVDVLRSPSMPFFSYDALGNRCLYLAANSVLRVQLSASNVTTSFFVQGADF